MYSIFALLWIVTFFPAWYLLLKLIAWSVSKRVFTLKFVLIFIVYQFVIVLPYLYLLLAGSETLSLLIKAVVWGLIAVGFILALSRFFLAKYVNSLLWYLYGFVYDGLRHFYPYKSLQEKVNLYTEPFYRDIVLDLGCGTGNQTILLTDKVKKVVAVDSSRSMLFRLKKKFNNVPNTNVDIVESDLLDYLKTAPTAYFDKIVMVNVLYAVDKRNIMWAELVRVMKPSGSLIVTNSDRAGNSSLIKEHLKHSNALTLLRPSLVAVFIIDATISEIAKSGHFHFLSEKTIQDELALVDAKYQFITRCYGDVNILFKVTK